MRHLIIIPALVLAITTQWGLCAASNDWQGVARDLCDKGRHDAADSLYRSHYVPGKFDPGQLVVWAEIKGVLEQYSSAAALLCEGMRKEPRLAVLMQGQFARILADVDSSVAHTALDSFSACAFAPGDVDTLGMGRWLPQMYDRFGLYAQERAVLTRLAARSPDYHRRLMDLAQMNLIRRNYREAVESALLAYRSGATDDARTFCAAVLVQAYDRLGLRDSAVIWLDRARVSGQAGQVYAVILYQQAGLATRADSVMVLLPPGMTRDTLQLRQLFFAVRPDSALRAIGVMERKPWWQSDRRALLLWKARIALFGGDVTAFGLVIDSIPFSVNWEYASEVVGYRYQMRTLDGDEELFKGWGAIELALYRGAFANAAAVLKHLPQAGGPVARSLGMRVLRRLLDRGEVRLASDVAAGIDSAAAVPEQIYYCAEILVRQGGIAQGRRLLEQVILRNPQDVFSYRARILLEKLKP